MGEVLKIIVIIIITKERLGGVETVNEERGGLREGRNLGREWALWGRGAGTAGT